MFSNHNGAAERYDLLSFLSFASAYSDKGLAFEINSAVISMSVDPKPSGKLDEPVIIASRNLREVDVSFSFYLFYQFALPLQHLAQQLKLFVRGCFYEELVLNSFHFGNFRSEYLSCLSSGLCLYSLLDQKRGKKIN